MAGENVTKVLWAQLPVYFRPVMEFQELLKVHGWRSEESRVGKECSVGGL